MKHPPHCSRNHAPTAASLSRHHCSLHKHSVRGTDLSADLSAEALAEAEALAKVEGEGKFAIIVRVIDGGS